MCSPDGPNFDFQTISDSRERDQRNQQIDQMYDLRNSPQEPIILHQESTEDIFPPKQGPYNPNFNEAAMNRDRILDNTPDLDNQAL